MSRRFTAIAAAACLTALGLLGWTNDQSSAALTCIAWGLSLEAVALLAPA